MPRAIYRDATESSVAAAGSRTLLPALEIPSEQVIVISAVAVSAGFGAGPYSVHVSGEDPWSRDARQVVLRCRGGLFFPLDPPIVRGGSVSVVVTNDSGAALDLGGSLIAWLVPRDQIAGGLPPQVLPTTDSDA